MNTIKNKLNNNHGVSILFGLLLFMVASIVSIVIISASSTSAKRSYYTSSSLQESQAVESLALFMKKEINGKVLSYTYEKNNDGSYSLKEDKTKDSDSTFNEQIKKINTQVVKDELANAKKFSFKVSASNLDDVKVSVYSITKENSGSFFINFLLSTENKNIYVAFDVSIDSAYTDSAKTRTDKYSWEYKGSNIKEVSPNV